MQKIYDDLYLQDTRMLDHVGHTGVYVYSGDVTALVDTGLSTDVDTISSALEKLGVEKLDYIMPTHVHLDHAGGAGFLAERHPEATMVVHENGAGFLTDEELAEKLVSSVRRAVGELGDLYGTVATVDESRVMEVSGGERIDLGDRYLKVVNAGGHAPHQYCLHDERTDALFTADEVGMYFDTGLYVSTPPPDFDLEKNLESLERISKLRPAKLLYTHFGPRGEDVEEVREILELYTEKLRGWVEEVEQVWMEVGSADSVVEEFLDRPHDYYDIWDRVSARETVRMDVAGVVRYLENR
ncbi:MAG: MBL fold metallo-hydrolase [Halobacteria archaeon]